LKVLNQGSIGLDVFSNSWEIRVIVPTNNLPI
jgi:hypothetical protein